MHDKKYKLILSLLLTIIVATIVFISYTDKNVTEGIYLTKEERVWLDDHKDEIKIGYTTDYHPVEFLNKGEYAGISADYLELLEIKLGIKFQMVEFDSFDKLIEQAKSRKLAGITAATKTEERSKYLDFTLPYIDNPNVIITRKNFSEKLTFNKLSSTSMDIIVIEGYDIIEFLNEKFPKLEYRTVKSPVDGMRMVAFGEADAMIIEIMSANSVIEKDNLSNLVVNVETPYDSNLSIATRNDWPMLNQILNKGLAQISDSEKRLIDQRWMPLEKENIFLNKYFWVAILSLVSVLLLIIVVISIWNSSLHAAVVEKTKALEESKNELMFKTYHDELTGLYNRAHMTELLRHYDKTMPLPFSIIVADLNGLKITNDTFGHDTGDQMLIRVSNIIKANIKKDHIACRIGGDEIVVFMPLTEEAECDHIVKNIKNATLKTEDDPIKPLVALGHASTSNGSYDFAALFKIAEDRMYVNKMADSEANYDLIINSLKKNLYKNKYENEAHHERLAKMCKEAGQALKLNKQDIDNLILLAQLHDLGKIGLDNKILVKDGPLTYEEWESVKRHPELGFKIVSASKKLSHIGKCILASHESWDGSGYPQGLKGEEIPLTARLFNIIEAYDVMTHERPYGGVYSKEKALNEILASAGLKFDPDLARWFCNEADKSLSAESL